MAADQTAETRNRQAAELDQNPDKLSPREEQLLAEVLAAKPTLSRDEALRQLRAAGM